MEYEIYGKRADLYDIAFSWDIEEEVDWLLDRLGRDSTRILEPACGSGRMFPPFARRGVQVVGVEISEGMIDRARRRMAAAGLPEPSIVLGDMARFDLRERFDGAICPINSFGFLHTVEAARSHLCSVADHLKPGGRYLLQVDLHDLRDYTPPPVDDTCAWEEEEGGVRVKAIFSGSAFEPETCIETEVVRIEVLSGPETGFVLEEEHFQRLWSWEAWFDLIASSPFTQAAAYSGLKGRPGVDLGPDLEHTRLAWHELERAQ